MDIKIPFPMIKSAFNKDTYVSNFKCQTESQFTVKLRNMWKLFLHLVMER